MDFTAQKMKFSIKDFFSKCDQILSFLRIWSHLLKKSLIENFIICAVLLLNLSDKINLKRSDKYVALSNLSIHYTRKDIRIFIKI